MLETIESIKKIRFVPSFYLLMILYFFSIDILTAKLLGYETKDLLYLIDIKQVLYVTSAMILGFVIIGLIVKKSIISTIVFLTMFVLLVSLYTDYEFDPLFKVVLAFFVFVLILVHNLYAKAMDMFLYSEGWRIFIEAVLSLFLCLVIFQWIITNISDWRVFNFKNKIELINHTTPRYIMEPKSFNRIRLQNLNQKIKIYATPKIINELSSALGYSKDINKDYIEISYDNNEINNRYPITINYYDVDEIKNIFIVNPNKCENDVCHLYTLILRRVNKNDTSHGYSLIAKYIREIKVKNLPKNKFMDSFRSYE